MCRYYTVFLYNFNSVFIFYTAVCNDYSVLNVNTVTCIHKTHFWLDANHIALSLYSVQWQQSWSLYDNVSLWIGKNCLISRINSIIKWSLVNRIPLTGQKQPFTFLILGRFTVLSLKTFSSFIHQLKKHIINVLWKVSLSSSSTRVYPPKRTSMFFTSSSASQNPETQPETQLSFNRLNMRNKTYLCGGNHHNLLEIIKRHFVGHVGVRWR